MSITSALSIAASGLRASGRRAELAANNIANAEVEGYTRKEADLATVVRDGAGQGVGVAGVRRPVVEALGRDARREGAGSAFLDVQADALNLYTQELGQPDEERSVASSIARLEEAFIGLADAPEASGRQRGVVQAAKTAAERFNTLSGAVRRMREDAEAGIETAIAEVNEALAELETVNTAIKGSTALGRDSTGLEDRRDALIDRINERVPVRAITRAGGDVLLLTEQSAPLLDGEAAKLTFERTADLGPGVVYAPSGVVGPGQTALLSGLTIDGRDLAPGAGNAQTITGGRIAGLFAVRDTIAPALQGQLDGLASSLAERFQANDPSLGAAGAGLFTDDGARHVAGDVVGMAERIRVNAAIDPDAGGALWRTRDGVGAAAPGAPGEATQVRRFLRSFDDALGFPAAAGLSNGTLRTAAAELVGDQQARRADAATRLENQKILASTLRDARENAAGVNVDTELQKIVEIERSYAANAAVIQTSSRMLDELMRLI